MIAVGELEVQKVIETGTGDNAITLAALVPSLDALATDLESQLPEDRVAALTEQAQTAAEDFLGGDSTAVQRLSSESGQGEPRFAFILALIAILVFLAACTPTPVEPAFSATQEPTAQIVTELPSIQPTDFVQPTPVEVLPEATATLEPNPTAIPVGVIGGDWDQLSAELHTYLESCFAETGITGADPQESIIFTPAFLAHFGGETNPFMRFRNLPGTTLNELGNYEGAEYGPHDALLCGFDAQGRAQYIIFTSPEAATAQGLEVQEDGSLSPSNLDIQWKTLEEGSDLDIDDIFDLPGEFGLWWVDATNGNTYYLLWDADTQRFVFVTEQDFNAEVAAMNPAPEATATAEATEEPAPEATATAEAVDTRDEYVGVVQFPEDLFEHFENNYLEQFENGKTLVKRVDRNTYELYLMNKEIHYTTYSLTADIVCRAESEATFYGPDNSEQTIFVPTWIEQKLPDGSTRVLTLLENGSGSYISFVLPANSPQFTDEAVRTMLEKTLSPEELYSVELNSIDQQLLEALSNVVDPVQTALYLDLLHTLDYNPEQFWSNGDTGALNVQLPDGTTKPIVLPLVLTTLLTQ